MQTRGCSDGGEGHGRRHDRRPVRCRCARPRGFTSRCYEIGGGDSLGKVERAMFAASQVARDAALLALVIHSVH